MHLATVRSVQNISSFSNAVAELSVDDVVHILMIVAVFGIEHFNERSDNLVLLDEYLLTIRGR